MISTICPICNGLSVLSATCPTCGQTLEDTGKIEALYGPYSPYRPIDDLKLTNGYEDLQHHQCVHVGYCFHCQYQETIFVQEVNG